MRNAERGGTILRRIGEQHRRLETRHQTLVAVGRGIGESVDGLGVFHQTANVIERRI